VSCSLGTCSPYFANLYFTTGGKCLFQNLNPPDDALIEQAVLEGRNGKGIVFVFAAGNGYYLGDDTSQDNYQNTRYTISVGAVGQDGKHAPYSTPGTAVFVSAREYRFCVCILLNRLMILY
jgi:subtilisin family serine protease